MSCSRWSTRMENKLTRLERLIRTYEGPPIKLMEVCGTHTSQIFKFGIPALLSQNVTLISGPGCPVCVTPAGYIDRAAGLARSTDQTLLSFGDMMRVPGRHTSLLQAKAAGGGVELIYSPMDALRYAIQNPKRTFTVAAVGFETTLPLYALLLQRLIREKISNVRLLMAVKALMPALRWICGSRPDLDGFIGPGHVSTILGWGGYEPLCEEYRIPMAVAGFSYEQLIAAVADLIRQNARETCEVHNLYSGAVSKTGNAEALALTDRFFELRPSLWRGLGEIDNSGYCLSSDYKQFDADTLVAAEMSGAPDGAEPEGCLCGRVLTGRAQPVDCGFFGASCTPAHPIGPCMVSGEGTCGIWFVNQTGG